MHFISFRPRDLINLENIHHIVIEEHENKFRVKFKSDSFDFLSEDMASLQEVQTYLHGLGFSWQIVEPKEEAPSDGVVK